jgi:urease accessory protein
MRRWSRPFAKPCLAEGWKARLSLGFQRRDAKTILNERRYEGPLVVQKPLYPEGEGVCHAIIVHPPGGIAGGDELHLKADVGGHALLTTPGAAKWYRSAGPWAQQKLQFDVQGTLEWLPRETIVFDGALAKLDAEIRLGATARFIGWDVVCLGRTGSGERFRKGSLKIHTSVYVNQKLRWLEHGTVEGGGALMASPAGLAGHSVFGTLIASEVSAPVLQQCKSVAPTTSLSGVTIARYLGDSTEEALNCFTRLWTILRPALTGRDAVRPRIWNT